MQYRLRASMNVKRTQLSFVKLEWTKEWDDMSIKMTSSSNQDDKEFGKIMESLEFDSQFIFLKQELLQLYLEKVRYIFALAFF